MNQARCPVAEHERDGDRFAGGPTARGGGGAQFSPCRTSSSLGAEVNMTSEREDSGTRAERRRAK